MTLSFSSFSIKDILSGRDARELADNMRTGGLCTEYSVASHRGADERLSADHRLSDGNLRSDSNSLQIAGGDYRSVRRDGKQHTI